MPPSLTLETMCAPSRDVVAREIEGEVIIVPLVAGIGDADDELYTLNDTGRAIWRLLDGRRTLAEVVEALAAEYEAEGTALEADVLGFADELARRGILGVVD
ncbi:MAG: PqqD family protein [Thermoleophilia bacterium]